MDSERLRPLLTARGPFASVYFEDSHDTQDADTQLELRWRGLREQLQELGADESMTAGMERVVLGARPPVGHSGRGVIACGDGVVLDEHLIRPTATPIVRLSKLPYVIPIIEHGVEDRSYLVVAVDHTGADLTIHAGSTRRTEPVQSGDAVQQLPSDEDALKNLRAVADRVEQLLGEYGPERYS